MKLIHWHQKHLGERSAGDVIADNTASFIGSWTFLIYANIVVLLWIILNCVAWFFHWDAYPFILLNLVFSWAAFNSTPLIMMSQNRAGDRDRAKADHDYEVNQKSLDFIEKLAEHFDIRLDEIEADLKD